MTRQQARAWISVAVVAAVACAGCKSQSLLIHSDHLYLDTSEECCGEGGRTIEILQEPPQRPYEEIAYVEAFATFYADSNVSWDQLRNELCRQAIELQADAIIHMTHGSEPFNRELKVIAVKLAKGGGTKKLTGIAIRYTEPDSRSEPP